MEKTKIFLMKIGNGAALLHPIRPKILLQLIGIQVMEMRPGRM